MMNKRVKIVASAMSLALLLGCCYAGINVFANENTEVDVSVCKPQAKGEMSVEHMKEHLEAHGYSESDMALLYVCSQIEEMQKVEGSEEKKKFSDKEVKSIVGEFDDQASAVADDESTGTVSDLAAMALEVWNSLTADEKTLVVTHPVKALAVNATSNKATELAIVAFGVNGLGDKSDGFRHAIWNCLMTREIGKDFAEKFANAHESGKSEEDLKEVAADGFEESLHLEMDLHNNEVGRSIIGDGEPIETYDDKYIFYRVMEKMTNNKVAGEIYWLHD